jgi:hypothetical protein
MERVRRVAPCASQIATCQPHEDTRQSRTRAFALNRLENFRDGHGPLRSAIAWLYQIFVRFVEKANKSR